MYNVVCIIYNIVCITYKQYDIMIIPFFVCQIDIQKALYICQGTFDLLYILYHMQEKKANKYSDVVRLNEYLFILLYIEK